MTQGRNTHASYAGSVGFHCWIVNAWTDVCALTVVQAFAKAGIISEL